MLGVDKTASRKEIESAYRKRARDVHPDRGHESDAEFKLLTSCRDYLLNKEPSNPELIP